jgi:thioredoxin 1
MEWAMLAMVQEVSDAAFASRVLAAPGAVLVEFGADWCPPCRAMAPVLEGIARDKAQTLTVLTLDVDRNPRAAERYGALSLPTLILFRDGEPVERLVGARAKSMLLRALEPHLRRD